MIQDSLGRLFILLAAGIWLGGFIMLGYGVAPVNFGIAESWQLDGVNPSLPEQHVNYRTIGGALTGDSIARLNQIESLCLTFIVLGLALAWRNQTGSRRNRIIRTFLITAIVILFYYYVVSVGGRLMEIRNTVPIDFGITDDAMKSALHLEFDRLHKTYTRTASVVMMLLAALFALTIFDGTGNRIRILKKTEPADQS